MEVQMSTGQSLPCVRVPISSTNTKLRPSSPPSTQRHATVGHSPLSLAPAALLFRPWESGLLIARQIVASLTSTPQAAKRNPPLCSWVAPGRPPMSSSSGRLTLPSSFGGGPGAISWGRENRPHKAA